MKTITFLLALACPAFGQSATVNSTLDVESFDGFITLREAINGTGDATSGAETIDFDPGLSGLTINLAAGQLLIDRAITIDATSLPAEITIHGGGVTRIFNVDAAGQAVLLKGLTLSGGFANISANYPDNGGGAISSNAVLTVERCAFRGNNGSQFGGAISNNNGTLNVIRSTFSGNSAISLGGAIDNYLGTVTLTHCTVTDCSADRGGGINQQGELEMADTIVAGNTAGNVGPNILSSNSNPVVLTGKNIIGDNSGSSVPTAPGFIGSSASRVNPVLAPFGNYGGGTSTRPPLPGSPAINAANSSTSTSDQRGLPIVGIPDIGAVELQGETETAEPLLFFFFDSDKDGTPNGVEEAIGTNPAVSDPSHPNNLRLLGFNGPALEIEFGYADRSIPLKITRSTDLINFDFVVGTSEDPGFAVGEGSPYFISDPNSPAGKAFYRLEATRPD